MGILEALHSGIPFYMYFLCISMHINIIVLTKGSRFVS